MSLRSDVVDDLERDGWEMLIRSGQVVASKDVVYPKWKFRHDRRRRLGASCYSSCAASIRVRG